MSKIRLHGSSSGYTEIAPVAASGNNTITLPNDGTIISKDSAGAVGVTSIKSSNVNVGAAVTITESGIEASGIGITCANINGTQIGGRRNIIVNGAMNVAQRGSSSTSTGYQTIDRFGVTASGADEAPTQAQVDVASGTTPYTLGFRKAFKLTNGNQTGGAGATDRMNIYYNVEAQDIANSGWNYTSTSSFVTLSFWVKSSVAQNFYGRVYTPDGTNMAYIFETGSLSADTWTKVTKTIPGNSNLTFNDDTGSGWYMEIAQFIGTDYTDSGVALNNWAAWNNSQRYPDYTSTWYSTNDATFEYTGVQLEVGSQATAFEHRSKGEEISLCQRYYYLLASGNTQFMCMGDFWLAGQTDGGITLPVEMRATPSLDHTNGADYYKIWTNGTSSYIDGSISLWNRSHKRAVTWYATPDTNRTAGHSARWITNNSSAHFGFSAEL